MNRRRFLGAFGVGALAAAGPWLDEGDAESTRHRGGAGQARPFVVDLHVHMSQPPLGDTTYRDLLFKPFKAQYDGDGNRLPNPKRYTYLPEQILERMDQAGVDVSFVMMGEDRRRGAGRPGSYEYLAEQVRAHPGRFVGMPSHDPLYRPYRNRDFVKMCADYGFRAIKLLAPYEQYNPYDERIWPFYEACIEHDVSVTFHTGWPPTPIASIRWANVELEGLDEVGIRFPELKVHLAHAGGPHLWQQAVLVAAKHDSFSLDFSSWGAYPPQQLVSMIALARDVGGIEKVMFGSEHSQSDPAMLVQFIRNINVWAERLHYAPFDGGEIAKILGLNAARKWGLSTELRF